MGALMIIFPAIDIKDSKCVRLIKGDFDKIILPGQGSFRDCYLGIKKNSWIK